MDTKMELNVINVMFVALGFLRHNLTGIYAKRVV
jgi:hypothetical protein